MPNMSYCRFQNTYQDLLDCYEAMAEDEPLSEVEKNYRMKLIGLAMTISADYEDEWHDEREKQAKARVSQ